MQRALIRHRRPKKVSQKVSFKEKSSGPSMISRAGDWISDALYKLVTNRNLQCLVFFVVMCFIWSYDDEFTPLSAFEAANRCQISSPTKTGYVNPPFKWSYRACKDSPRLPDVINLLKIKALETGKQLVLAPEYGYYVHMGIVSNRVVINPHVHHPITTPTSDKLAMIEYVSNIIPSVGRAMHTIFSSFPFVTQDLKKCDTYVGAKHLVKMRYRTPVVTYFNESFHQVVETFHGKDACDIQVLANLNRELSKYEWVVSYFSWFSQI